MIYVDRSTVPIPGVLLSSAAESERERISSLLRSTNLATRAQLRITFDESIWTAAYKDLRELFHGKCAYCETKLNVMNPGEVEHFRPRQGAQNFRPTVGDHLHYAWLAYEWENLLISCLNCNRVKTTGDRIVGKGQYFPVNGERAPLLSNIAECRQREYALLIDPTFDKPGEHLWFDGDGMCRAITPNADATIELLALNRKSLVEARANKWREVFEILSPWIRAGLEIPSAVQQELLSPEQEYLATARAALYSAVADLKAPMTASAAEPPSSAPRRRKKRIVLRPTKRFEKREPLPPFAHRRIRRIQIRNFKAIEHLDFELHDPVGTTDPLAGALMLLGENASGKSTVLEAISLALLGTTQIKRLGLRAQDYLRRTDWKKPLSKTRRAEVKIYFEGARKPVALTIDPKTKRFRGNDTPATVLLAYGPRRFFSDERGLRRPTDAFARVQTLFKPLAVLTNPKPWLLKSELDHFSASVRALRPILLLPDEAIVVRGGKEVTFELHGTSTPLARLSEGYKTVAAMSVDIMREMLRYWPDLESARGVVLVDEIETHLHPRWKMRIVQRLRTAMPQVQFIATTHDPLCLRGMFDGEVQVLARDEGFHIERVTNVPNVRGLSVEQLLLSEFFGLFSTEDPRFEESMSRYVALATKSNRTPEEEDELAIQRQKTRDAIVVGDTPQSQLVQEAVSQYLLDRETKPAAEREGLKRESLNRIVDLWKELPE